VFPLRYLHQQQRLQQNPLQKQNQPHLRLPRLQHQRLQLQHLKRLPLWQVVSVYSHRRSHAVSLSKAVMIFRKYRDQVHVDE
jgi:hypothetical protein